MKPPQRANRSDHWALVVIDMQNDFLDRAGYYAVRDTLSRGEGWFESTQEERLQMLDGAARTTAHGLRSDAIAAVVANIRAAISVARAATRPVAFVRAAYDRSYTLTPPSLYRHPERRHFPCRPGSWGADIIAGLADLVADGPEQLVCEKHTYDAFSNPVLTEFLAATGTATVVICGTETQTCVLASAQHSALAGWPTMILEDCVWSPDESLGCAALTIFRNAYGETLRVSELRHLIPA